MDTIFALASAQGKASVAVVRISGPSAFAAVDQLSPGVSRQRGQWLRTLVDSDGAILDQALLLSFVSPNSFTGEDVVELHLHGSPAIVRSVLTYLGTLPDLRMAEAGEFTRRALENGKMDLAQVEGLADLIDAETEAQRRQAQRVFSGELGGLIEDWRTKLVRAAALIEATIDFADEEVPVDVSDEVRALLLSVQSDLKQQAQGVQMAERIRDGFEVAIVGRPNTGKSTLLNTLAGRQAAITSDIAGTTRDVIEVRMDLGGLAVTLLDTAGLRETDDVVEGLGIEMARSRAAAADVRVFMLDPGEAPDLEVQPGDITLRPKADLLDDGTAAISGKTGLGVDQLIENLRKELEKRAANAGVATRLRHQQAMERAVETIDASLVLLREGPDVYDLLAEMIRSTIRSLEMLVGRVDVENLLDEIFSSFCIGK